MGVFEAIAPPRLGRNYRWLLASSWTSNLADGIGIAAGPLLVASQTDEPSLVALAAVLQRLPWPLVGLFAGVIADRVDRRVVVIVANGCRAVVFAALAVAIGSDVVNVWIVMAALFVFGAAETFADITSQALLPMVVEPRSLGIANARLMFGFITLNNLVGPPLGAALFAAGMVVPFVAEAVLIAFAVLLVRPIALPEPEAQPSTGRVRDEIAGGFRWLWRHGALRTLTIAIVTFNLTFGAAWSVLVLLALQRLDLGEVGFGVLLAMSAAGGVVGTTAYGWLERRASLALLMRIGLTIETLTWLVLALTRTAWVAMAALFCFGAQASVWGTTSRSIRQRAVPVELQGRIGSMYMIGVHGGIVLGGATGAALAGLWGVTAPYWYAFIGSALIVTWIWGQLDHVAHAGE